MITGMATRQPQRPNRPTKPTKPTTIHAGAKTHFYITEHFRAAKLSDAKIGERINRDRATVFKWRKTPDRLDANQLRELASAMPPHADGEPFAPDDFRRPPGRPDLNRLVEDAPEKQQKMIIDVVLRMVGRAS